MRVLRRFVKIMRIVFPRQRSPESVTLEAERIAWRRIEMRREEARSMAPDMRAVAAMRGWRP